MKTELEQLIEERNIALSNLDLDYARKLMPQASSDDVLLLGLHKARYDCIAIARELRHESADFLRKHGCKDMNGQDILPEGILPE